MDKTTSPDYGKLISESCSKAEFARKIGFKFYNGTVARKINAIIEENKLSILHFDGGKSKQIKYPTVTKKCPVCQKDFKAKLGERKEKQTCSYACANKHFRSGENNGMWKDYKESRYTKVCFKYHKKECVVCQEENIVSVHHFDHNHDNNDPANLVPLCPTHHQYVHSRYNDLVKDKIEEYVINFKKTFSG